MQTFKKFNNQIQKQFDKMCQTGKLFRSDISGREIWNLYLSSFETGNNPVFRDPESSEHNCNCCNSFIRRYGNIVSINENGELESIFSNIGDVMEYNVPVATLDSLITSKAIKDVFFETFGELNSLPYESCKKNQEIFKLGIKSNLKQYTQEEADKFGVVNTEKIYEFDHFNLQLPKQFVDQSGKSIEQITAHYRDKYFVFKRAMEEISIDTLRLVRDLISQGSLLDGTAHLHAIEAIIPLKDSYQIIMDIKESDIYCWYETYSMDERVAKFKNTLVSVLCTELAENLELNKACEN